MDPTTLETFFELHAGLPRQGPGSPETTARAYAALRGLPAAPRVLDVGCGPGAQTIELARLGAGHVLAIDFHEPFLAELRARAAAAGLSERIEARRGDMRALELAPGSFDLLWSEGAIYIAGFEEGLRAWRPLLVERGFAAVTEATWLRPDPPEPLRRFWEREYPAIRDVAGNVARAEAAGFEVLGHFPLPESCWWNYFGPIEAKLEGWLAGRPGDPVAAAVAAAERQEMALYRTYGRWYGYVFYLLRSA